MLLRSLFLTTALTGCVMATSMPEANEDTLIIGCCPWDDNMKGYTGLNTAQFVDFMDIGTTSLPDKFHHLDFNNTQMYNAKNFTPFAEAHRGEFKSIIVDWATYQHIRREEAWEDFATLLKAGGNLIVPINRTNFKTGESLSMGVAKELINKSLASRFAHIETISHEGLTDSQIDFYKRPNLEPGRLEVMTSMLPVFIIATKAATFRGKREDQESNITPAAAKAEEKVDSTNAQPIKKNYEAVPYPTLDKIMESLREGRSFVVNANGNVFNISSIWGFFNGFKDTAEITEISLKSEKSEILSNKVGNQVGILTVNIKGQSSIKLTLNKAM